MYAPQLGRFISRDPLPRYTAPSLYEYVKSMPTRYLDPTGLEEEGASLCPSVCRDSSDSIKVNCYGPIILVDIIVGKIADAIKTNFPNCSGLKSCCTATPHIVLKNGFTVNFSFGIGSQRALFSLIGKLIGGNTEPDPMDPNSDLLINGQFDIPIIQVFSCSLTAMQDITIFTIENNCDCED